jgi:hypothetical protein
MDRVIDFPKPPEGSKREPRLPGAKAEIISLPMEMADMKTSRALERLHEILDQLENGEPFVNLYGLMDFLHQRWLELFGPESSYLGNGYSFLALICTSYTSQYWTDEVRGKIQSIMVKNNYMPRVMAFNEVGLMIIPDDYLFRLFVHNTLHAARLTLGWINLVFDERKEVLLHKRNEDEIDHQYKDQLEADSAVPIPEILLRGFLFPLRSKLTSKLVDGELVLRASKEEFDKIYRKHFEKASTTED